MIMWLGYFMYMFLVLAIMFL